MDCYAFESYAQYSLNTPDLNRKHLCGIEFYMEVRQRANTILQFDPGNFLQFCLELTARF